MSKLGIAVLGNDNQLIINRGVRGVERVKVDDLLSFTWGNLCQIALKHDLLCIWLCPGSAWSTFAKDWHNDDDRVYDARIQTEKSSGLPVFVSVKRLAGTWDEKRLVMIGLPEHDSRWSEDGIDGWALADVEDAITLLGALCYLRDALGVDVLYSPGYVGQAMMKDMNQGHAEWVALSDLSMLPTWIEGDVLWTRPLTEIEQSKKYLHFYDRNSMYLAATTGAELGEGSPDYVQASDAENVFSACKCGVWRVSILGNPCSDLPPIVPKQETWADVSIVRVARDLGYSVMIYEGYVWKRYHRTLQPWSKRLWDVRSSLNTKSGKADVQKYPSVACRDIAYKMIKIIATRAVGWLDLTEGRKDRTKEQWHRPDWKNAIVGLARARMFLKLVELHRQGFAPVAVYTDAIAYVSDDPNPETAVPNLMRRASELGGFKHIRTIKVTKRLVKLFDGTLAPFEVLRDVKKLVGGDF
jgi:hypothetical protein